MMILIADDSEMLRERLVGMLSELPGVGGVRQAQNVPETLALARTLRPDVLILDIHMPGGSGIDVLREIKREQPDTTVIMLTSHSYPQYRERCFEYGASYFFSKTDGFKKLLSTLETLSPPNVRRFEV